MITDKKNKTALSSEERIKRVRLSENDVGSLPVQIVLLEQRINCLKEHLSVNRGDMRSKAAFFRILRQRKKLLCVLLKIDEEKHNLVQ